MFGLSVDTVTCALRDARQGLQRVAQLLSLAAMVLDAIAEILGANSGECQ